MDAIRKAEVKKIDGGCQLIILPNGADGKPTFWPGLESNTLLVRPEFERMFGDEEKLGAFSKAVRADRRHKLLLGIPGIGKSSFGLCVFAR